MMSDHHLIELIQTEIDQSNGKITFNRFMELALYAPNVGYYNAHFPKFGKEGDFVTAPELSPLFAQCIAHQCLTVLNQKTSANILEIGSGTGKLAFDILKHLTEINQLPTHYYIFEISEDLKRRQQAFLKNHLPQFFSRIQWLEQLPKKFNGIMIANEVMDAFPVHRFRMNNKTVQEFYVGSNHDGFHWILDDPHSDLLVSEIQRVVPNSYDDYESEINFELSRWINALSQSLESGLVLLIDYGFHRRDYYHPQRNRGTLMCHYQHRNHDNPFLFLGQQDITAHVDFTSVAETAVEAGLTVAGYTTQAFFLLNLGLAHFAQQPSLTVEEQWKINQQLKLLTLPSEMGELFKVMALTKNFDEPLAGFSSHDFRYRL